MSLPPSQSRKIPEGAYTFTVSEAPTKQRHNSGTDKEFVAVVFFFRVEDSLGNSYKHRESLVPWDPIYQNILIALGGELDEKENAHLGDREEDLVGRSFEAEIIHAPDKDDPTKTWARVTNVESPETSIPPIPQEEEDVPPPINGVNGEEDEIPF